MSLKNKISLKKKIIVIGLMMTMGFFVFKDIDSRSEAQWWNPFSSDETPAGPGAGPSSGGGGVGLGGGSVGAVGGGPGLSNVSPASPGDSGGGVSADDGFGAGDGIAFDSNFLETLDVMDSIVGEIAGEINAEVITQVEQATKQVILEDQALPSVANDPAAAPAEAVNETS